MRTDLRNSMKEMTAMKNQLAQCFDAYSVSNDKRCVAFEKDNAELRADNLVMDAQLTSARR